MPKNISKKGENILKFIIFILGATVVVIVAASLYALAPKPIQSEKISANKSLEFVRAYPETSSGEKSDYYQGKLYKAGKINVVALEGSYGEMGRQYGALLREVLNANYEQIIAGIKTNDLIAAEDIEEEGGAIYDTYPEKYKEIVNGLAETSGLGIEKTKFLLAQETYVYAVLLKIAQGENISGAAQCSGLAVWNEYTPGGEMIFGRNYDLGPVSHEYAVLTIFNPTDGSLPTANFTFAGAIYVTSGMNRDGLFLELNNGSASDKNNYFGERTWAPAALLNFLEQSESLDDLAILFNSGLPDMSYIINAASQDSAYSFEWSTNGVKKREPDKDGVLAATNIFFDPAWGAQSYDVQNDPDAIVKRRDNLIAQAEENKGKINPEKMMEIISTPLEDGGTFRAPNFTSYEIVAEPAALKLWLRVPEYQDWTEVNLAEFFNKY